VTTDSMVEFWSWSGWMVVGLLRFTGVGVRAATADVAPAPAAATSPFVIRRGSSMTGVVWGLRDLSSSMMLFFSHISLILPTEE